MINTFRVGGMIFQTGTPRANALRKALEAAKKQLEQASQRTSVKAKALARARVRF
jgi:hypothetical protein